MKLSSAQTLVSIIFTLFTVYIISDWKDVENIWYILMIITSTMGATSTNIILAKVWDEL